MADWLGRVRAVCSELASQGLDAQLAITEPFPEQELLQEEAYDRQLTGSSVLAFSGVLRSLYAQARTIKLRWKTRDRAGRPMFGGMHLMPLATVYESEPGADP